MGDHYCVELQIPETNARDIDNEHFSSRIWSKLENRRVIQQLRTNVESYVEQVLADGLNSKNCNILLKDLGIFK